MSWLQNQAISIALPYLMGPLVFVIVQASKKAWMWIDHLPAWQKQAFVFVVAQLLVFVQSWSGQELACGASCTLADITPVFVKGVLTALSAYLLHFLKKAKP